MYIYNKRNVNSIFDGWVIYALDVLILYNGSSSTITIPGLCNHTNVYALIFQKVHRKALTL